MPACGTDGDRGGFAMLFALAVILSAIAAAAIAPLVAYALAAAGIRVVFPRIFDRVVMVAAAVALGLCARRLRLGELLRDGFGDARRGWLPFVAGLAAALATIAILLALAIGTTGRVITLGAFGGRVLRYLPAAVLIGVVEEGFFRAVLLGGLRRNFTARVALIASSAIYAAAHLVRAPRHTYLTGFQPAAGFANLAASLARLAHPGDLLPMVFGLFLLGLILGEAFRLSGRVYLPIGLHAGFVVGAKCWPLVAGASRSAIPRWLAGAGPVPLIAAPAAWVAALSLLVLLWAWFNRCAAELASISRRAGTGTE